MKINNLHFCLIVKKVNENNGLTLPAICIVCKVFQKLQLEWMTLPFDKNFKNVVRASSVNYMEEIFFDQREKWNIWPCTLEIRQSTIYYTGLLGRWDKRIVDQESNAPSIIFFYTFFRLRALNRNRCRISVSVLVP